MKSPTISSHAGQGWLTPRKRTFLTGTLLLTGTGFLCRVLGFFYRIFMSRTVGAEGLGIYNMVHPIFGICFAVCAGSIQTALSQYVAANEKKGRTAFRCGLAISLTLSVLMAVLIFRFDDFMAAKLLLEPRCAPYLPVMALSVPFAALHACINGYYYGMQKARVPAFSQVAEQVVRMAAVFLIVDIWAEQGRAITVTLAVYGHLIGEIASAAFTFLSLLLFPPDSRRSLGRALAGFETTGGVLPSGNASGARLMPGFMATAAPLMALALPLMGNRLVLNFLGSAEAIWIPNRLVNFGLSSSEAFSTYGVLTGMSLPFILFPSAITNSMAVLLLPTVAQAQSDGNEERISSVISMCLRYSCYMGILCIGVFTMFGSQLGVSVFRNRDSGTFITILAWLCPFMYLATTLGSVLNGLGRTSTTFIQNVAAMLIRLCSVIFAIPAFGILGYLWGLLISELALALLNLITLKRLVPFRWNAWSMILKPSLMLGISIGIYYFATPVSKPAGQLPLFIETGLQIGFLCACYMGLLLLFHKRKPLL